MADHDTCVVIPVFNEEQVIADVITGVLAEFDHVVCVDDGSTDSSVAQILGTSARLVRHPVNLGQGAALQTGIEFALADPSISYLVTYDADGQHRVEDALAMVDVLRHGDVDVVFGSRFLDGRTEVGRMKKIVLKSAVRFMNATSGLELTDAHNGLRAMTRHAASQIRITQNGMAHASEIVSEVARTGLSWREVPVEVVYTDYSKAKGQSLWNSVNILFDLVFR